MNILVCGKHVNYYVRSSYILTQYSSSTNVLNYGHEEMRGGFRSTGMFKAYISTIQFSIRLFFIEKKNNNNNKKKTISTNARKRSV